jgi:hypothetical protein
MMDIYILRQFFGWSAVINMGILLFWCGMIGVARNRIYKIHSAWFRISEEQFNAIHYLGIMFYKLTIFGFFIVPYIVLRVIG